MPSIITLETILFHATHNGMIAFADHEKPSVSQAETHCLILHDEFVEKTAGIQLLLLSAGTKARILKTAYLNLCNYGDHLMHRLEEYYVELPDSNSGITWKIYVPTSLKLPAVFDIL